VPAVQPYWVAGRAGDAQVQGGGRDLDVEGRLGGGEGLACPWPRDAWGGRGTRGPQSSCGVLAMSCLPELARLAFSWITRSLFLRFGDYPCFSERKLIA